jgi:AraC-like DNA-binding protein
MKGESLSMVAAATGFADQSHFTRTFKRVTGATPHEWHQNRTHYRMRYQSLNRRVALIEP